MRVVCFSLHTPIMPGIGLPDNSLAPVLAPGRVGYLMIKRSALVALSAAIAVASGCIGFERKSTLTGPTATGMSALMGSWTSSNIIPDPGQCTDFKWNVDEQTGNSASGRFSATCAGDLKLNGTARGTLSGSIVAWSADADATAPELSSCSISLLGTAELLGDSIRVTYSGTTCLGPVNGVETLHRR